MFISVQLRAKCQNTLHPQTDLYTMDKQYDPQLIEETMQSRWDADQTYRADESDEREKFYCLEMFPYPSGKLHMGHVRNYTIGDVISRYQRQLGKSVLHPMGWDAFGLPAENAAIQNKTAPASWTHSNIAHMREQLKRLGFSYDWNREFATCEPDYYRWEQWFFTQLYERGLVYNKEAEVNWDPIDQTVLANEQVIDGRGWRSGALVVKKKIPQWFIKITDYAEELLAGLDDLEGWPDAVKIMQRNWIGKSVGAEIEFTVAEADPLRVFTTRPDTLMGATYLAVAADHPLTKAAAEHDTAVQAFREECQQMSTQEADLETMEKKGVPLDFSAIHPVTGESVPIWSANFVLMSYGTGAVMAVPAHDQRDYEFASKYSIAIKAVVKPLDEDLDISQAAFTEYGVLIDSGEFDGLSSEEAKSGITAWLSERDLGAEKINYRLRDWGVSRQRYWGCPIPFVYDENDQPVPAQTFPVELPTDVVMDGVGSPIKSMASFIDTVHPVDGTPARRETDTFDTFFESSWYYARYCCPDLDTAMLDQRANHWLPVDQYVGGIEHAVMHLLYARFFHKLMRDVGLIESDEPFTNLLTQGMVTAETFYRDSDGTKREYFNTTEVDIVVSERGVPESATLKSDGSVVEIGPIEKMSKSKNNGVDPQQMINKYGADTVRLFTMFAAPPDQSLEWNDDAIAGASRFLRRVWNVLDSNADVISKYGFSDFASVFGSESPTQAINSQTKAVRLNVHTLMSRVLRDYERQQFNTVVAAAMELTNLIEKTKWSSLGEHAELTLAEALSALVRFLLPVTPHVCEYVLSQLDQPRSAAAVGWLTVDESALIQDEITYVVQVNGKLRGQVSMSADAQKEQIEAAALADENVQRFTQDLSVVKVIVVPKKLVNIVVK